MSASVTPLFSADKAAMLQHLEHLFGGYLDGFHDGKIELAWNSTTRDPVTGKYKLAYAEWFGTDQLHELVDRAAEINKTPNVNVYIGAALRHPNTAPFGRSKDIDAWALTALYADLDDAGATATAKDIYGDMKPTLIVRTGTEPYTRAQLWWRLAEPLTDPHEWEARLRGLGVKLHGDLKVCNPGRVMRLAGSIAWPVKEGRNAVEMTAIVPLKQPGPQTYHADVIAAKFPAIADIASDGVNVEGVERQTNALGLPAKITDGRESYMRDTLLAVLIEYVGENGTLPSAQELFEAAWPQYSANVDFSRPGRGPAEMAEKCDYLLTRFNRGQIRHLKTLDDVVAAYQSRQRATVHTADIPALDAVPTNATPKARIELIPWDNLPEVQIRWLIKDFLPHGGFAALYGKPGSYKSFVALYIAATVAHGAPAFDRETTPGDVLYIAGEGGAGLKKRRDAFVKHYSVPAGTRVHFIKAQLNLRSTLEDATAVVEAVAALKLRPVLVIIDTLARAFAGGNENASEDMGAFIAVTGKLQEALGGPTMLVVHHSGKDEARGMRGHSALLGAVDTELEVVKLSADENPERVGQMTVTKQKDGEDGFKISYRMETVPLGLGAESSLVVVPDADMEAPVRVKPLTPKQRKAMDALERALSDEGSTVANANIPATVKCARMTLWRENFYALEGENGDAAQKAFRRSKDELAGRGLVGIWTDFVWKIEQ